MCGVSAVGRGAELGRAVRQSRLRAVGARVGKREGGEAHRVGRRVGQSRAGHMEEKGREGRHG